LRGAILVASITLAGLGAGCQPAPGRLEAERLEACAIAGEAGQRLLAKGPATFDPVLGAPAVAIGAAVSTRRGAQPWLAVQGLRLKVLGEQFELARHLDCTAEFARRGLPSALGAGELARRARQAPVLSVKFGRPVRLGDWAILEERRLLCRPLTGGHLPVSVLRPISPVRLARRTPAGWVDAGDPAPGLVRYRAAKVCAWSAAY